MAEENQSKVDRLSDNLYSRTRYKDPLDKRSTIKEIERPSGEAEVESKWATPALDDILARERQAPEITPMMKKFFTFAALFFSATILVAGFVFLGGSNFISSKNVDITVIGPTSSPGGEVVELEVTIENENNADLELANFSVQFPQGARDPEDSSKQLTFTKDELGEISAGDEVVRNVRFFLIGSLGEVKELKFSVEYKVKGSNATFYKDKIYEITIGSTPLSLTIQSPQSVTSGESFKTVVSVKLNSTEVLKNVMLRAEYPYGYSVITALPAAFSEDNVWALGDLSPGSEKKIEITGQLVGENRDERTFRFYTGVADNDSLNPNFRTVILSAQETVAVERPSIALNVSFNGETSPIYIAPAGQTINTAIRFQNNLPEKLLNPRVEVKITGSALNESSITTYSDGFYNSGTDKIIWSPLNNLELAELSPGEDDSVSFSFTSLPEISGSSANREIILEITLSGTPVGSRDAVRVTETRKVRIASQVTLSARSVHSIGPYTNRGTIPPLVEKETTYTILWSVGNTQNDLTSAKVTARLGPAVRWLGAGDDGRENITYDETTNTVTWNLETLSSGSGFSGPLREAAFQVGLTPSSSQLGTVPVLVNNIVFTGFETEADRTVTVTNSPVTTRLSSDPAFIQGDDIVGR